MHPTLHILDVRLEVSSDQEALIEPFLGFFSTFSGEPSAADAGIAETAAFREENVQ
ncbi:MAG: hypothetical protein O7F11_01920 [Acidobacteria bacterium]|nr:hypothetical protein [Acidobacteriota bacterium]